MDRRPTKLQGEIELDQRAIPTKRGATKELVDWVDFLAFVAGQWQQQAAHSCDGLRATLEALLSDKPMPTELRQQFARQLIIELQDAARASDQAHKMIKDARMVLTVFGADPRNGELIDNQKRK